MILSPRPNRAETLSAPFLLRRGLELVPKYIQTQPKNCQPNFFVRGVWNGFSPIPKFAETVLAPFLLRRGLEWLGPLQTRPKHFQRDVFFGGVSLSLSLSLSLYIYIYTYIYIYM